MQLKEYMNFIEKDNKNKLEDQIKNLEDQVKKSNDLITKEIMDIAKLEDQVKKSNDLLVKQIEEEKNLKDRVKNLENQMEILKKSNEYLFNEIEDMKKKNLVDENCQYMQKLNIQILKEGIDFNNKNLEYYKTKNDLENFKIELIKRDLYINDIERLINVFIKDLLVKGAQIDKLKEEIEGLKNAKK